MIDLTWNEPVDPCPHENIVANGAAESDGYQDGRCAACGADGFVIYDPAYEQFTKSQICYRGGMTLLAKRRLSRAERASEPPGSLPSSRLKKP